MSSQARREAVIRFECAFGHGAIRGAGLTVGQAWSLVCWWLSAATSLGRLWQCRKELAHAGTRVFSAGAKTKTRTKVSGTRSSGN